VVLGQVLRALARGDHLESRRAAPVDHLADERGLVAVRERIHDAGLAGTRSEERTGERVGLDVDHHDVLAVRAARERMADARRRWPVASITTSTSDEAMTRSASSVTNVVPWRTASGSESAA
jgi:hypothetical protein